MRFDHDARVTTAEGQDAGHLDRVVLDPRTKAVTHIVIQKGLLLSEEKVVPVDWIASTGEDQIILRREAKDLESLPKFYESEYLPLDEQQLGRIPNQPGQAPFVYWYPPLGLPIAPASPTPYVKRTAESIPEGTIALKEGARVVTKDGKRVGELDEVVTESSMNRATYIVVSKGRFKKKSRCVPAGWIDEVKEDELRLAVGSRLFEQLWREEQPSAQPPGA